MTSKYTQTDLLRPEELQACWQPHSRWQQGRLCCAGRRSLQRTRWESAWPPQSAQTNPAAGGAEARPAQHSAAGTLVAEAKSTAWTTACFATYVRIICTFTAHSRPKSCCRASGARLGVAKHRLALCRLHKAAVSQLTWQSAVSHCIAQCMVLPAHPWLFGESLDEALDLSHAQLKAQVQVALAIVCHAVGEPFLVLTAPISFKTDCI